MSRRRVLRYAAGDVVFTSPAGAVVRYSPADGASHRYSTTCRHHKAVNDRTLADARWSARHPDDFCVECAAGESADPEDA
jgi:hypothetical protein